jgi:hypothetical protein
MRNQDCKTCGGFGFTLEHNGEEEFMTGCAECSVAAQEADSKVLVLRPGETRIDVRPEPPRGVAYTFGGLS